MIAPSSRSGSGPLAAALILVLALGCAPASPPAVPSPVGPPSPVAAPAYVFPDTAWDRIGDPESVGWSRAELAEIRSRLEGMSTAGLMAVVGGRVLFEYGDVEVVSYLASVRKSILTMLLGNYVASGVADIDRTLGDLGVDDHGGLTEQEREATVRHLLQARSGVYLPASNPGDDLASAPERGSKAPGEYYLYSNWDFNALGTAFERLTGRDIYDALETDLAIPLGMRDFDRARHQKTGDLTRSMHPAYHMHLSTRDMARVGYLMLREGAWRGEQLIPRAWVEESTRLWTPRAEMNPAPRREGRLGYGYTWWIFDHPDQHPAYEGAYVGLGAIGQQILVVPALDLVIAHKTIPGDGRQVSHGEFLEIADRFVESYRAPR
jgi:CubicO group peptidase (beta-lactamase class C family)